MTTPVVTTMTLQIAQFHNCEGCIRKVRKALSKIGCVQLVRMDPDRGEVTVRTGHPLELIMYALKSKFPKKDITLLQRIVHHPDPPTTNNMITNQNRNSLVAPQHTFDLGTMARSLEIASNVENQASTSTSTTTVNNRRRQPSGNIAQSDNNYQNSEIEEELDD